MIYDLIRLNARYHLIPRGTAHTGLFICAVRESRAREMGWL